MLDGLTKIFQKALGGSKSEKDIKKINPIVDQIHQEVEKLKSANADALRAKTKEFQAKIAANIKEEQDRIDGLKKQMKEDHSITVDEKEKNYKEIDQLEETITEKIEETLEEILPEAFAVVQETARRFAQNDSVTVTATDMDRDLAAQRDAIAIEGDQAVWNSSWNAAGADIKWEMVHYDVQLIGGTVLHRGNIAEMATGEGKTLVATLPVYINALAGRGVHVVTVNDYLAKRDSEWMGPIFEFHGMSVDCIDKHQPNSAERRAAYAAHITYGTNNEFGFDYLRDNMATHPNDLVQRGHNFAIVDEVDSVLIDDARTPLIISGPTPKGDQQQFSALKPAVEVLVKNQRELVTRLLTDAKRKLQEADAATDKKIGEKAGEEGGLALFRAYRGLPKNKALIKFLSEDGRRQQLQRTENFYLQENSKNMPEADKELFFVIDEKQNSIELTEKGIELISGGQNDANFFVLPDIGAELAKLDQSGVEGEEKIRQKETLIQDYSVKAERVHSVNQLLKAYTLFERDVEYVLMDNKIKIVDEQTGRIMDGRRYSDGLHQAIEAKENVKIEAATQTYASVTLQNYFRMYNKLSGMTGTAETEAGEFWEIYKLDVVVIPTNRPIQRDDREDLVYKTTREKFNAVIEEVVKLSKAGRPVLVGTTSVEVSELLSRMLKMRKIEHNVLNAKLHQREAEIVAIAGQSGVVTIATNMAGRGTDIKLTDEVKKAGGLAIIGTERHDSRRVDRQLRGRSGRQGDPGSSQFFVSLEDNLMRLFGSDRIAKLMDRMGYEEGEVIQHSMITKSIERAQKKVEENNFGIRKRLLEYDDVMNKQREAIYEKRRNALYGERLSIDIADSIYDVCSSVANEAGQSGDYEDFSLEVIKNLAIESPISEAEFADMSPDQMTEKLYAKAQAQYTKKQQAVGQTAFPVIKEVYENQGAQFTNIQVPFTDGRRALQIQANLEEAYNTQGASLSSALEKHATLGMIDLEWKEHLREMDDLRQNVQNAQYEQKDPLLIYKFESFELFEKMVTKINKESISFLLRAGLPSPDPNQVKQAQERRSELDNVQTSKTEVPQFSGGGQGQPQPGPQGGGTQTAPPPPKPKAAPVRVDKKVGRNDPCPCGSGKKFKQCHGKPV